MELLFKGDDFRESLVGVIRVYRSSPYGVTEKIWSEVLFSDFIIGGESISCLIADID